MHTSGASARGCLLRGCDQPIARQRRQLVLPLHQIVDPSELTHQIEEHLVSSAQVVISWPCDAAIRWALDAARLVAIALEEHVPPAVVDAEVLADPLAIYDHADLHHDATRGVSNAREPTCRSMIM